MNFDLKRTKYPLIIFIYFLTDDFISSSNEDIDEIVDFLLELCEREVLRGITCDFMVEECFSVSQSNQELRRVNNELSSSSFQPLCSYDCDRDCCAHEMKSFMDILLDIVIKLDFPEKLVTFLLQLLPHQEYKVCFASYRVFYIKKRLQL